MKFFKGQDKGHKTFNHKRPCPLKTRSEVANYFVEYLFYIFVKFDTMEPMIITYYGSEFVKIQAGETILAFNPIAKESDFKSSRFGADIVLVSLDHVDFNGVENLTYKEKTPFLISGPGEYEVKSVFVKGFMTDSVYKDKNYINTIYIVKFDGINICHLGALSSIDKMTSEIKEAIGDVDILFAPVGSGDVLGPDEMNKISVSIAPKIIIPTYYNTSSQKEVESLMKEIGNEVSLVDKLVIKKRELSEKEGEIIMLSSQL